MAKLGVLRMVRKSTWSGLPLVGLASLLGFSGCSTGSGADEPLVQNESPLTRCGTTLGVAPLDNACGHAWVGPFGDSNGTGSPATPIAASAASSFSGASPNFASPQRLYRVSLPGTTSHQGTVKFTPAVTEDISIGTDVDTSFTVLPPSGAALTPLLNQDVTSGCVQVAGKLSGETGVGLKRLRVYRLTGGTTYRITFGPTSAAAINVELDEPNDYLNAYFTDADADGYGDPNSPLVSECTAPAGSVSREGDCNDANASISPAASDATTDGVDNDCDGSIDDPAAISDLETVSLAATAAPTRMAVGQSVQVVVTQTVTNNGIQATDATVTRTASASAGGSITPASVSLSSTSLALGEYRVSSTTYNVSCTSFGNVTYTVNGAVAPTRSVDTDPEPSNNAKSVQFTILCAPCMEATSSLVLADRARVTSADIVGGHYFELGSKATATGNVSVDGNAFVRSEGAVTGTLRLSGMFDHQNPYSVPTIVYGAVSIPAIPQFTFPVGTADLSVGSGSGSWTPGTYRDATVGGFATANLTAGTYNLRSLTLSPDANLAFNTSAGDVFVNAEQGLSFADRSDVLVTGAGKVLIYTNSTGTVRLGTDMTFAASLSAPKASIQVYSRTTINGCTSADRIQFEPDVTQNASGFPVGLPGAPTTPPPSCSDGVQNGSETGLDCGGSCLNACPTCTDGLKNGTETGVDCGGGCMACPTCSDGIKNGTETGVDCGGSCGTACGVCASTTYQAESMSHSAGTAITGGWNLSTNGFISTNHNFVGGPSRVSVVARGVIANGVGPHMVVRVGGVVVGDVMVSSTTYQTFTFNFTTTPGSKEIRVTYDNDSAAPNRDLILDFVQVVCVSNSSTLSVNFPVTANWGTGYCVDVAITNTGTAATNSWTVVLNTQQSTIYTLWNAFSTGITGQISLTPFSWNRNINPGQTIRSVGFCANRAAGNTTALPSLVSATGS